MAAHSYANRMYSSAIKDAVKVLSELTLKQAELATETNQEKKAEITKEIEELNKRVKEHDTGLDFSLQTGQEIYSASLAALWANFKEPTDTVEEFLTRYETDLLAGTREECKSDPIIEIGWAQKGIVSTPIPEAERRNEGGRKYKITTSDPLTFTGEIRIEMLEDILAHSTLSGALDWSMTLRELLTFGERIGMNRAQIAKSIKVLTKHALPHYFNCIERVECPNEVWSSASTFVDLYSNKRKIKKALDDVTRHPGEDLSITLNIVKTLVAESLRLDSPDIKDDVLMKLAKKHAQASIEGLVEKNCWDQLNTYRTDRWRRLGKSTSMEEAVRFVNETEATKPEYALQSAKRIKPRHISVDINHVSMIDNAPGMMEPVDLENPDYEAELNVNLAQQASGAPNPSSWPMSRAPSTYGGSTENVASTTMPAGLAKYELRSHDANRKSPYQVKSNQSWEAMGHKSTRAKSYTNKSAGSYKGKPRKPHSSERAESPSVKKSDSRPSGGGTASGSSSKPAETDRSPGRSRHSDSPGRQAADKYGYSEKGYSPRRHRERGSWSRSRRRTRSGSAGRSKSIQVNSILNSQFSQFENTQV